MNILITGIHGFVGSNLVNYLKDRHTIYGLDIVTPIKEGVKETFLWDSLDKIPAVDAIIHLAGKAHDTKGHSLAQVYFDINTGLTQKIYDWYLKSTASKFIFFSSVKAAADYVEGDILTEDIIPRPKGAYGESKIAAEQYIQQNMPSDDKYVYIFRPCMIHGPGNKGNLNLLYSVVRKGVPYPLGAFDNSRSFTSIDNLTYIIEQVISQPVASGIYNIADDEPLSTNELIALICQALGRKSRIWKMPKSLINSLAKVGDVLHLPLNTFRLDKLTENYVVSNSKIKAAIGLKSLPTSSNDGIVKTIKSFK